MFARFDMNRNIARIVLISAGLIWGAGFIVNKYVMNSGWDDSQLLFVRFFTAAVFIFLIFFKKIIRTDKDTVKQGMFLGVFLFLGFFFQTWGLENTSASNNALITAGYIVVLPLIVYVMEKRMVHKRTLIAAAVTFIGIIVISVDFNDFGSINVGDIYTFIGAVFWGVHIYLLGIHAKKKDPIVLMAFQLLVVSVLAFIAMMIKAGIPQVDFADWNSVKILLAAVLIGFFASFVAFTFQSIGQKHSNETEAAILISTESVFGPILAVFFLNEVFNFKLAIGIILVFGGVILSEIDILSLIRKRKKKAIE
jgi:drug/metabolite transporter (DMT)-like permease